MKKKTKLYGQVRKEYEDENIQIQPLNSTGRIYNNEDLEFFQLDRDSSSVVQFFKFRLMFIVYCLKTLLFASVRRRDRELMSRHFGRDITTYLYFQQQMLSATILCSFIGFVVLLPVHLTGTVPEVTIENNATLGNRSSPLLLTSINMRITEPPILTIHVILSVIFILVFIFFMVFQFLYDPLITTPHYLESEEEILITNKKLISHNILSKLEESNIARPVRYHLNLIGFSIDGSKTEAIQHDLVRLASPFCVCLLGVPALMNQQSFSYIVYEAAKRIPEPDFHKKIVKVILIPNLKKTIRLQSKLNEMNEKLEQ